MKIAQNLVAAVSALIILAAHAATASAYTMPKEADKKGNRVITCNDKTQFTHNGTYADAEVQAKKLCEGHQGYVSIGPVQPERLREARSHQDALLENGPIDANGGGASAPAAQARPGVRAGVGRGQ